MNQIVNDETEDKGTVNVGEFWESVEYKTLVRIFLDRVMQGLKIKSNFNYWAPCIRKYTTHSNTIPNTEYKEKQNHWKI